MKYRPEIDGLRAVSVIAVVVYHARFLVAGERLLPGGFIGVDVFFVISGYLITRLVADDLRDGTFSLRRFYERRARRILPALLLVLAASAPAALWLLDPDALQEFARSILSSLLFSSNIFFWLQDSYIAEPSQLKPLLHTWSLSVEEQFYLLFPPVMILLSRRSPRARMGSLLLVLGLSLGAAQYLATRHAAANFFLAPTRAWELLAGAVVALLPTVMATRGVTRWNRYLPTVGLLSVLWAMWSFSEEMAHPSLWTAIPIVGTTLVIRFASGADPATRLLSCRPLVGVGLMSYSLYLWHFPIFAFGRTATDGNFTRVHLVVWTAAAVILGALSWKYIEQPFRKVGRLPVRRIVGMGFATTVFLFVFAGAGATGALGPDRVPISPSLETTLEPWSGPGATPQVCVDQEEFLDPEQWCPLGRPSDRVDFLLIGDSHAFAHGAVFDSAAAELGMSGRLVSRSGCPMLLDLEPARGAPLSQDCLRIAEAVIEYAKAHSVERVVLALRWNYYSCGEPQLSCGYTQNVRFRDAPWSERVEVRLGYIEQALALTMGEYEAAGLGVRLVAQVPHQLQDPRAIYGEFGGDATAEELTSRSVLTVDHLSFTAASRDILAAAAAGRAHVGLVDPSEIMCDEGATCPIGVPGTSFYTDVDHIGPGSVDLLVEWAEGVLS